MADECNIANAINEFVSRRTQGIALNTIHDMQVLSPLSYSTGWNTMSNVQNIMRIVEQAVEDYSMADTSNTFVALQDVHPGVQPCAMMAKTCYVEFDPMCTRAKLPSCFAKEYGPFIQHYVILQDPKRNQIRVSIEKKNTKIYFTRGWSRLKDFYDIGFGGWSRLKDFYAIGFGGWLTVLYIKPLLFHIRVRKLTGLDVAYPERNPPCRILLPGQTDGDFSRGPVPYFVTPKTFCHTLEKTLTSYDIESGILKLSWDGFYHHALPNHDAQLTLVDWYAHSWTGQLELQDHPHKTCTIYGQWCAMCKARKLSEGLTIKFGVTGPTNNTVIHFRLSPLIGLHTTLIAPKTNGGFKAFYQAYQYYML